MYFLKKTPLHGLHLLKIKLIIISVSNILIIFKYVTIIYVNNMDKMKN